MTINFRFFVLSFLSSFQGEACSFVFSGAYRLCCLAFLLSLSVFKWTVRIEFLLLFIYSLFLAGKGII